MNASRLLAACVAAAAGTSRLVPARAGNPVPDSERHEQCDREYEDEAVGCGRITSASERQKCDENAFGHYKACRSGGQEALNKCKQRCDDEYADDHKKREKMEDGPEKARCRQAAGEKLGRCYETCRKKKKGG